MTRAGLRAPTRSIGRAAADAVARIIALATVVVVLALIVYPIGRMIVRAFAPGGGSDFVSLAAHTFGSNWFGPAALNTVIAVGISGALAIVIAAGFAWLNERTDASLGWAGALLPLLPLVIPPVAMAVGWVFLASPRVGFLNGILGWLGLGGFLNVLSWPGLIFAYTLSLVPFAYVLLSAAFRNMDPSLEEASRLSGAGLLRTLRKVSIPAIGPALAGSVFLVIAIGLGMYSIPLIIGSRAGIDILSVRLVRLMAATYPPQTGSAIIVGICMAVPIVIAWIMQQRLVGSTNFAVIGGRSRAHHLELGVWRIPARILMVAYLLLTSVLPLVALFIVAFQRFWTPVLDVRNFTLAHIQSILVQSPQAGAALRTSLALGIGVGLVTIVISIVLALVTRRLADSRGRIFGRVIDGAIKLPLAFSSIVIALGFVVALSGPPFQLGGNILILVLCYFVLFLPQASIAATSAVSQVGGDLLEASAVSGASEFRTFRRVLLPLIRPGVVGGLALVFVLVAGDLEAAALLASPSTPVIGFLIADIWQNGDFGSMAALVTVVTVLEALVVILLLLLGRQRHRRPS